MLQFEVPGQDVTTVAFGPDGRQLAAAGTAGRVDVFDLAGGGQTTVTLPDPPGPWTGGFILGGSYLFLLSTKGAVAFVNAATWVAPVALPAGYPSPARAVAPGGAGAAAAGPWGIRVDGFRRPHPRAEGPDLRRTRFEHRAVGGLGYRAVAFHPRGQKLLVARAAAGAPAARLDWLNLTTRLFAPAAAGSVPADLLAVSPDGGRYAAAGGAGVRV